LFKLSFRFLQDKVPHDFSRILPQMPLSRFAALRHAETGCLFGTMHQAGAMHKEP
jgi:hypothetical protein